MAIQITYAGICHSDLHTAPQRLGGRLYPVIPGHEIVGTVTGHRRRGDQPSGRRHGRGRLPGRQLPGVRPVPGRPGESFAEGLRPHVQQRSTSTTGRSRKGGYTDHIVVGEHFSCKVPEGVDDQPRRAVVLRRHHHLLAAAALEGRPGQKVGVVGLGGLGHMGVKLAHAMGAHVVAVHHQPSKRQDAQRPRRGRSGHLDERRRDAAARRQLRLHPQYRRGAARPGCLSRRCSSATARWCLVGARSSRIPVAQRLQPDLRRGRSPAR